MLDTQPNPTGSENAPKVTMGKERDISVQRAEPGDEAIRARGNLIRCFPARRAVAENSPAGAQQKNLLVGASFILAIIPLRELWLNLGLRR